MDAMKIANSIPMWLACALPVAFVILQAVLFARGAYKSGKKLGLYHIEQRNKFSVGETIEVMRPNGDNILVTVKRITDERGVDMESAPHPKQQLYIDLGVKLEQYDVLRRKED